MQLSFAPIVKRVAPAVVNVYASRTVQQADFAVLLRPVLPPVLRRPVRRAAEHRASQRSLGSGVIIDAGGLIVTNFHVIAHADEVKVALADKREFPADIVLKDERSDLAVLRIEGDAGDLPTIDFADSDAVEVGDLVLAIGDPFGVGQTVTSGIVSAFARVPGGPSEDQYFIQTDAAINPGNSGGALVDMQRPPDRHQPHDRLAVGRLERHRLRHPVQSRARRRRRGGERRPRRGGRGSAPTCRA